MPARGAPPPIPGSWDGPPTIPGPSSLIKPYEYPTEIAHEVRDSSWFHGKVPRRPVDYLLSGCKPGSFLVHREAMLCLGIRGPSEISHYQIESDLGRSKVYIDRGRRFKSATALLRYLTEQERIMNVNQPVLRDNPLRYVWNKLLKNIPGNKLLKYESQARTLREKARKKASKLHAKGRKIAREVMEKIQKKSRNELTASHRSLLRGLYKTKPKQKSAIGKVQETMAKEWANLLSKNSNKQTELMMLEEETLSQLHQAAQKELDGEKKEFSSTMKNGNKRRRSSDTGIDKPAAKLRKATQDGMAIIEKVTAGLYEEFKRKCKNRQQNGSSNKEIPVVVTRQIIEERIKERNELELEQHNEIEKLKKEQQAQETVHDKKVLSAYKKRQKIHNRPRTLGEMLHQFIAEYLERHRRRKSSKFH